MDVYCGLLSQIQIHHNILLFNLLVCEGFFFVCFSLSLSLYSESQVMFYR